MVFSSAVFLCAFLPCVLILYVVLPQKLRNAFLFAVSLLFYAWGEPKYIFIMLFSTFFDFFNGILIEKFDAKNNKTAKKVVLILSVIVNLSLLCFFKYTDFILTNINSITGTGINLLNIALPIGISFYTFQTLSYTIDVYRGNTKALHNILDFGMYICMFPQLIAGPIVRYTDIEGQIKNRPLSADGFVKGIFRFTVGLAKKVLVANQLGVLWDEIYATGGNIPVLTAWLGALAFMFQIYFDFSGYSDMAIGLGKMLGFDFPENFMHPYSAVSITDFWHRWHITLSTWFREYLYIPLGGNRKGTPRLILNLLIVWFLTGLWHGAGWNFILWGLFFFLTLTIEKLFLGKLLKKLPAFFGHIYTLALVLFSWVIFACDDMQLLCNYVRSLFGGELYSDMSIYYLTSYGALLVIAAFLSGNLPAALINKIKAKIKVGEKGAFFAKAGICIVTLAVCIIFVAGDSYNPFLYFRF